MNIHLVHTGEIEAPAHRVWAVMNWVNVEPIAKAGIITHCDFLNEINGVGGLRKFHLTDGTSIIEHCDELNNDTMTYQYSFKDKGALPLQEYQGRATVTPLGTNRCVLRLECHYTPLDAGNDIWPAIYGEFEPKIIECARELA